MDKTQHLIIIRGNSGSGKSTAAKVLRETMREIYGKGGTMLVSQDVVRIELLDVKDTAENESIQLIDDLCKYGMKIGKNVILEGILDRWKYGEMLDRLIKSWTGKVRIYYYDVPLEITLDRHDTRPQKDVFTKEDMRRWYNQDNRLNLPNERIFDANTSVEQVVATILKDCEAPHDQQTSI